MDDCPNNNPICHEQELLSGTPTGLEKLRNKLDGTSVNIKHNINKVMNGFIIHSNEKKQKNKICSRLAKTYIG